MRQPEDIEAMLSKLMPAAMSEDASRSMDEMLDKLCGPEISDSEERGKFQWKWFVAPAGIAAATALAFFMPEGNPSLPAPVAKAVEAVRPDIVLVGETDRIESLADEGWMSDPQGAVMQAVRVRVVEENTFRDEQTGIVMQISAPREELLLYQVNAF